MIFHRILNDWYSVNKRNFPWRETKDAYKIWLSEIILQQTQVKQGLPYYESFIRTFPTVFSLANADEAEVLKLWQGLGYYSRARNLHFTAKQIANDFDGIFPNNYNELLKLKGVGDYTASAIASICFNEITAVVDGNVYRFLARHFGISTPINSSLGKKEFKILAQKLIDKKNPADFNQAMMEFGAMQCKPKRVDCCVCPFSKNCFAFKNDRVCEFPVKNKKLIVRKRYFNYVVYISKGKKFILTKRTKKGIWQNLYEFPLIETKKSVSKNELLKNELLEKIKASNVTLYNKKEIIHKLSHQHIFTKFWVVNSEKYSEKAISLNEALKLPVPVLIANFFNSNKNLS